MVDFRIIKETTLEDFKKEIRKNLDEGFKMINSNLSEDKISFYYYAYMEKEV